MSGRYLTSLPYSIWVTFHPCKTSEQKIRGLFPSDIWFPVRSVWTALFPYLCQSRESQQLYGLDTSKTYFDCTSFYFEIDREDDFRRKGPSKEGKRSQSSGLAFYWTVIRFQSALRCTPEVADKGLNCAPNIAFLKKNGDGYFFSKSVKGLPETAKTWIFLEEGFREVTWSLQSTYI